MIGCAAPAETAMSARGRLSQRLPGVLAGEDDCARLGRFGDPLAIADGGNSVMEMKTTDFGLQ